MLVAGHLPNHTRQHVSMVDIVCSGSKSHVTSKDSVNAPKPVAAHEQQAADVGGMSAPTLWLVEWVSCSGGYAAVTKQ